jgi:hypothetical protein
MCVILVFALLGSLILDTIIHTEWLENSNKDLTKELINAFDLAFNVGPPFCGYSQLTILFEEEKKVTAKYGLALARGMSYFRCQKRVQTTDMLLSQGQVDTCLPNMMSATCRR